MGQHWNDKDPIFLQIRERIVSRILEGALVEEEQLPSVRRVASDLEVNPLTVMKAYQLLVDEEVVEKRRGLGMFVRGGAAERLLEAERRHFLDEEWPLLLGRILRLGLSPAELLETGTDEAGGTER